jgi:hypothetical protein
MRALRMILPVLVALSLSVGSSVAVLATSPVVETHITPVSGSIEVNQLPGGTWDVEDRVYRYRDFPLSGNAVRVDDPRLAGYMLSDWNWDVAASGKQPVPAWGTMEIAATDGSWKGAFSGIRRGDFAPIAVRAILFGDGAYEGLCATLDISATGLYQGDRWFIDGIIHPDPMS